MMVEPTQRGEVVRVVVAIVESLLNVVGLEPIERSAPVDRASTAIPMEHMSSRSPGNGTAGSTDSQRCAIVGDRRDFDGPCAADLVECRRTHPGAGRHPCPGLTVRGCSIAGIHEHSDHRTGSYRALSTVVLADLGQSIGPSSRERFTGAIWKLGKRLGGFVEDLVHDSTIEAMQAAGQAPRRLVQRGLNREVATVEPFAIGFDADATMATGHPVDPFDVNSTGVGQRPLDGARRCQPGSGDHSIK